jgi:ATP-dependent DNA helicase RecQ
MTEKVKYDILKEVWGYSTFRQPQKEVIDQLLLGKDCLVIMPTGGGKSLCYQLPALLLDGLTVVISPLIALMNDQVAALEIAGIDVAAYHSNMSREEQHEVEKKLELGNIKLLYISPERANSAGFHDFLARFDVRLFAIDEAHCVSIWGNDFRPDYVTLHALRDKFIKVPFIALTATADAVTQDDICQQLHLKEPQVFVSSFERPNIYTESKPAAQKYRQVLEFINKVPEQFGIIYCLSRKETEKLSAKLSLAGYNCAYYHAGMSAEDRLHIQKEFQDDKLHFICATIAFGMGIDKSNIQWIIHYSMPKTLEGYYQEIGRAGRDGAQAKSLLLYSWGDYLMLKGFIDNSPANENFKIVQYAKLDRMWEFASAYECRTNVILNYFGEFRERPCGHCDNCLFPPKRIDATHTAQKALSAVIRCKESVGINLLIDVLRGSNKTEVREAGFDRIKTFGAGRDISFFQWKIYITQLINQGLLRIDYADGFKLKTTPLSRGVLFEDRKVQLTDLTHSELVFEQPKKVKKTEVLKDGLIAMLKDWRYEQSKIKQVPAYVIFSDKTIENIAEAKPMHLEDLISIDGIGKVKLDLYGADIIAIVQSYLMNQDISRNIKGKTYLETLQMYNQGEKVEEIAHRRQLSPFTIYSHLAYLYAKGESIDIMEYITEDDINRVRAAWVSINKDETLGKLAELLENSLELYKIKLALAVILRMEGRGEIDD